MSKSEDWDLPDLDATMKAERQHDWISEPRFKKMFSEIEDGLQGVLGKGTYDWVDRRVFDAVFDRSTLLSLHKLMEKGDIETVDYPIARGKEAHVFHATSNHGPVAVKIFHTTNAVFKSLTKYIDGDPRFGGLKRRHRELVKTWVRKEYRNLKRMRKVGLPVPRPLAILNNVLIMDLIGDRDEPAPRLKDVIIDDPKGVFDDLLDYLAICWQSCDLVHGDFSEYNVLWYDGEPWIIDVGQAVVAAHPNSEEFLVRDVTRLVKWINSQGYDVDLGESLLRVLEDEVPTLTSYSDGD
jgi:RIO kinase 1|tara:strand:+ start:899 stop:1783 length:885 start_codon:yes stop_codon:yes gene_type:complete